jgi:glutaminase
VADYIPQLAMVDPSLFAVSVVSTSGEVHNFGDSSVSYSMQSTSKPFLYAVAQTLRGAEKTHQHVSYEPSGQRFNAFCLTEDKLPHNPMVNAGAIMTASLIAPGEEPAARFNIFKQKLSEASGNIAPIHFDNSVFLSERQHADRNRALAYYMKDYGAFEKDCDLDAALEFYFQACSICMNTTTLAALGATLANQGRSCITQRPVFEPRVVRNTLALMHMCGMYDASGKFAFEMGLPAKSGVSGCLLLVIPGIGAVATFSPPLDRYGNSVRGGVLFKRIAEKFPSFHIFERNRAEERTPPPMPVNMPLAMIAAAAAGDIDQIQSMLGHDSDLCNAADYDGRSALHLAVCEAQVDTVEILLSAGANPLCRDRWGATPRHEATKMVRKAGLSSEMKARTFRVLELIKIAAPTERESQTISVVEGELTAEHLEMIKEADEVLAHTTALHNEKPSAGTGSVKSYGRN